MKTTLIISFLHEAFVSCLQHSNCIFGMHYRHFGLSRLLSDKESRDPPIIRARVAPTVKNLPAVQEIWAQSLGWEDPLEEEMATSSSIPAWKIPWT